MIIRMDQSCSIFGMRNSALLISFKPKLDIEPVPFPKTGTEHVFVIAHTMVTSDKHVTAPVCYNLRVVETRLASLILAKALLPNADWKTVVKLRQFHELYAATQHKG